jgi:hypothetical protein
MHPLLPMLLLLLLLLLLLIAIIVPQSQSLIHEMPNGVAASS